MKRSYIALIFLIVTIYSLSGYLINSKRILPIENDEAVHLEHSFYYHEIFRNPSEHFFDRILDVDAQWPPLYHFLMGLICFVFNTESFYIFLFMHTISFILILFLLYLVTLKLIGCKKTALLSVVVFSAYPMTLTMYNWFIIEFFLTLLVLFSIFCLISSDYFRNIKYSLLFGVSFGLGAITKWTFIFFIVGPLVYVLWQVLKNREKKCFFNIFIALFIGLVIMHPWYSRHFLKLIEKIPGGLIRTAEYVPTFSVKGLLFYARSIYYEISFIFVVIFIITLKWSNNFRNKKQRNILFICIVSSYMILTLITNKWGHYIFPILPLLALITSVGIVGLLKKLNKDFLLPLVFMYSVVFLAGNSLFYHIFYPITGVIEVSVRNNFKKQSFDLGEFFRDFLRVNYFDRYSNVSLHNKKAMEGLLLTIENIFKRQGNKAEIGVADFINPPIFFNLRFLSVFNGGKANLVSFPYEIHNFIQKAQDFDFLVINLGKGCILDDLCIKKIIQKERIDKIYNIDEDKLKEIKDLFSDMFVHFKLVRYYEIYNINPANDSVILLLKKNDLYYGEHTEPNEVVNNTGNSFTNMIMPEPILINSLNSDQKLLFKKGLIYIDNDGSDNQSFAYTKFKIWNKTFDSMSFFWTTEKISKKELVLKGYCRIMPISQTWSFGIENNNVISWKVSLGVDMMVLKLEDFQANIVLPYRSGFSQNDTYIDFISQHIESMGGLRSDSVNISGLAKTRELKYEINYGNTFFKKPGQYDLFSGYFISTDKAR